MSQFTLALNTSTIRPASLMDKIRIAGETGYEAIELWNDDLTAYEKENGSLEDVKRVLDDYGLPVVTVIALHGWLDSTGAEHQEALEEAKRRMAQLRLLDQPTVLQVHRVGLQIYSWADKITVNSSKWDVSLVSNRRWSFWGSWTGSIRSSTLGKSWRLPTTPTAPSFSIHSTFTVEAVKRMTCAGFLRTR